MATERVLPPSGAFLAEWRNHFKRTGDYVAERMEEFLGESVDKTRVSKWETGALRIDPRQMRGFAWALGIEPEDLLRHPDDPGPVDRARRQIAEDLLKQPH